MKLLLRAAFVFLVLLASLARAQSASPSTYVEFDSARSDVLVFVHGVTGNAKDTWTNESTKAYWPSIVRKDIRFADTNVWVFSYASPRLSNAQNIDELARKLGDALRADGVLEAHRKIGFVAHSMGGLITRQYLVQSLLPPQKISMLYFFGTPTLGADLAGVAEAISANPQFENLKPFTRRSDVAQYVNRWLDTSEVLGLQYPTRVLSFCAYEINGLAFGKRIVNEDSASFLCNFRPRGSLANHVGMVKPRDEKDEPHVYLTSAYRFLSTQAAGLLTSAQALKLHTSDQPGYEPANLEVRTALIGSTPVSVGCNSVQDYSETFRAPLASGEQVLSARTRLESIRNVRSRDTETTFTPQGDLSVQLRIQGVQAPPFAPCPSGQATIRVEYLVNRTE